MGNTFSLHHHHEVTQHHMLRCEHLCHLKETEAESANATTAKRQLHLRSPTSNILTSLRIFSNVFNRVDAGFFAQHSCSCPGVGREGDTASQLTAAWPARYQLRPHISFAVRWFPVSYASLHLRPALSVLTSGVTTG